MKKMLILMLIFSIVFAACAKKEEKEKSKESTELSKVAEPQTEEMDTSSYEDDYYE